MATIKTTVQTTSQKLASATKNLSEALQSRPYQAPELYEVGSLDKLQHYGQWYHDGYRYKDDWR
jgi:hypothetical protein